MVFCEGEDKTPRKQDRKVQEKYRERIVPKEDR